MCSWRRHPELKVPLHLARSGLALFMLLGEMNKAGVKLLASYGPGGNKRCNLDHKFTDSGKLMADYCMRFK